MSSNDIEHNDRLRNAIENGVQQWIRDLSGQAEYQRDVYKRALERIAELNRDGFETQASRIARSALK